MTNYELMQRDLLINPAWYRIKLRLFHATMLTMFFCKHIAHKTTQWTSEIILCSLGYMHPIMFGPFYWGSIGMACMGLLYVEAETMWRYKPPNITQKEYDESTPINLMFATRIHHPLPKEYCTLSGVALLPTFTGWLRKLGKTFGGFISSMNHIGTNAILYISTRSKMSRSRLERQCRETRKTTFAAMSRLAKLVLLILACNGILADASESTCNTAPWRIDERDAL